jgi:hypothetical protein
MLFLSTNERSSRLLIIRLRTLITLPSFSFQGAALNTEAEEEADKRDSGKDTERDCLAFWLNTGCKGEEAPGEKGTDCAAGGGEGLGEAVEGAENSVVRSGVCDLDS